MLKEVREDGGTSGYWAWQIQTDAWKGRRMEREIIAIINLHAGLACMYSCSVVCIARRGSSSAIGLSKLWCRITHSGRMLAREDMNYNCLNLGPFCKVGSSILSIPE
jgi:hypothetical protein